ncbi:putative O-glycosylation ligase, exosortase A system-associated [Sphingopyxis sp. XHP0097]|uniref:O-glycosylation ligase, exosortase A system-associated n=1 Tax=Sphingopyxis jiangsuensis TaxID=2871171 RepID=A0ABS7MAH6_9SPHN|nr:MULTISPECIES: putative O-glycosylation ligase, exosortase A system-associated [Sphingopyxis]MBL0769874.1 putative O-glycosylation ligase, exosortase A system-associated [Sphingopyxis lutea]MBY4635674.1 putative O-glycosylation ligase, exosortase A system-associated [Sphingopyxis jiangsuensis]
MRDIAFVAFLFAFIGLGFRRPFLFVLAFCYIDIVAPQRLSYFLINSIPISLIAFALAILGWLAIDDKRDTRWSGRQSLLVALLLYCWMTTIHADFPVEAADKWSWVWKALVWAIFLPLTLRTKLRIEALALVMLLSAASIAIAGGIKTAAGGGGYGSLQLLLNENYGLYEGSIMSTVGISIIPLILWYRRHGTIFPPDWRVSLFAFALCFACMLLPVGTQARTGLVCLAVLAALSLRAVKYRFLYMAGAGLLALAAIPFLPQSFTERMETIQGYKSDQSASTRVAVWAWTWDYAKENPFGGGFEAYIQNDLRVETTGSGYDPDKPQDATPTVHEEKSRAYHSSYFEMLGEQGYPGLAMWLLLHAIGLVQMERLRRRYLKTRRAEEQWIAPLATALQHGHIVYMVGSLFVGIAFQPFIYMMLALEMGLSTYCRRREDEAGWRPLTARPAQVPARRAAPAAH